MYKRISGAEPVIFPKETMLGALSNYVTDKAHLAHISKRDGSLRYLPPQPINSNWAIVETIELSKAERKNKKLKTELLSKRAIEVMNRLKEDIIR
jgi:methylenetetrahydrofolate--tRNA-(uracil-5-)-methyltransferase